MLFLVMNNVRAKDKNRIKDSNWLETFFNLNYRPFFIKEVCLK